MLSSQTFKKYIRHEVPQTNDPEDQSQRLLSLNDLSFNLDALPGLREAIAKVTEKLISEAMTKTGGNQTVAARILGISQQSLSVKIQRLKTTSKRDYA
jgi:DNA-binding NtrC family response regulator